MPAFQFNKLVRDKLPRLYARLQQTIVTKKLSKDELLIALRQKLIEEASELPLESGMHAEIVSELSDVEQVMDDIRSQLNISREKISEAKQKKFVKKGGFSGGIFVEQIQLNDDDEWVDYYRAEPLKYPELRKNGHVDPDLPMLEKGTYRHTKSGKFYEVIGITFHTENFEPLVIYKPLYNHYKYELFVRPYDMFVENIKIDGKKKPRFEKIDDE